ncbi:MAG: hypothetical protein ACOZBZ_00615, partial [Patescibacteria group bacterium]
MGNEERKTGSILEKVAVNRRAFLAWLIVTVGTAATAACGKEIIPTPLATPTIPPSPTKEAPTPTLEVRPTPTPYKIETQMGGFGGELTLEEQAAVAAVGKR